MFFLCLAFLLWETDGRLAQWSASSLDVPQFICFLYIVKILYAGKLICFMMFLLILVVKVGVLVFFIRDFFNFKSFDWGRKIFIWRTSFCWN